AAYDWIKERAPLAAIKWFNRVDDAIRSLARNPQRCVAAPASVEFEQDVRQLVHGRRAGRYWILFVVEAGTVHVARAGIDPELISAYKKTGRLVTDQNKHFVPAASLEAWDAAIEEHRAMMREQKKDPQ